MFTVELYQRIYMSAFGFGFDPEMSPILIGCEESLRISDTLYVAAQPRPSWCSMSLVTLSHIIKGAEPADSHVF